MLEKIKERRWEEIRSQLTERHPSEAARLIEELP